MALNLEDSEATVKHVNARKEGSQEEKILAVDIKLELDELAVNVLPQFSPTLRGFLFDKETVRFPALGSLKWSGEQINMEIEICGFTFIEVRLSKFEIEPYINPRGSDNEEFTDYQRVRVSLSASFKPHGSEIATIAEMLGEMTKISIRARQQELSV